MALPTYRRFHAYQSGRQPPYSIQDWPIMLMDMPGDPLATSIYDAAVAAHAGHDYLYLLEERPLEGEPYNTRRITKRYWDDDDPVHRAGDFIAHSDPGGAPTHAYSHLSADAAGAYLYNIAVQAGASPGYQGVRDTIVLWQKRSPNDLSIVSSWDVSTILNDFAFAAAPCQRYPATGERMDEIFGARPAPAAGHAYLMRRYWIWPSMDPDYCLVSQRAVFGWDIIDFNLAAGTYSIKVDMPPPAGGHSAIKQTVAVPGLHMAVADDGDSIWFCQKHAGPAASNYPTRTGIWRSADGGANFTGPQLAGAGNHLNPYDAAAVDNQPLLLWVVPYYNGPPVDPDKTGFHIHALNLRNTADPLPFYWGRHPAPMSGGIPPGHELCEFGVDSDMWRYVHPAPTFCRFTYHADPALQRLMLPGGTKWTDSSPHHSPWYWSAPATPFTGDYAALWLFAPRIAAPADLNLVQDIADLIHIHVVGDDGLRQYRAPIADVAAAEPTVIGDYGVAGCVRQPDGLLRLLVSTETGISGLTSDDDGATWSEPTDIPALAGCSRPSLHPLAAGAAPQSPGGGGRKPMTYLLSAWTDDDIRIYRAQDAQAWAQISVLAAGVPEQKTDLIVNPDGRLRAYYYSIQGDIYSRASATEGHGWFAVPLALSGCTHPAALILPHGEVLLAAWQGDQLVIARSHDGKAFGAPLNVRDAGGAAVPEHGSPHKTALARALDGMIYLWFFDSDELKVTTSDDSGHTWQ